MVLLPSYTYTRTAAQTTGRRVHGFESYVLLRTSSIIRSTDLPASKWSIESITSHPRKSTSPWWPKVHGTSTVTTGHALPSKKHNVTCVVYTIYMMIAGVP